MGNQLNKLITEQQQNMSELETILENDRSSIDETLDKAVECAVSNARLIQALIPLKEVSTSSGQQSTVDAGDYQEFVDIFDQSKLVRKAFEIRDDVWESLTYPNKELAIISVVNEARIKRLHDSFVKEMKQTNEVVSEDMLELLGWYVSLSNLTVSDSHKAKFDFPKVGSFFDRSTMIPVVERVSGRVEEVLLPGIERFRLKALVRVK
jgi:hypothetical protein